ncbi:hypothetical protein GURASL_04210 [Geotalea uraniireducens]|uniref:Uncharacterized protein n=1 Tax=Geotalea uraniireducens TaxID=351604 RepID=A0ABM8EGE8_9BACT|nr:hypothetical protein GURASL_04210 [Geotalea uraniireducens]
MEGFFADINPVQEFLHDLLPSIVAKHSPKRCKRSSSFDNERSTDFIRLDEINLRLQAWDLRKDTFLPVLERIESLPKFVLIEGLLPVQINKNVYLVVHIFLFLLQKFQPFLFLQELPFQVLIRTKLFGCDNYAFQSIVKMLLDDVLIDLRPTFFTGITWNLH